MVMSIAFKVSHLQRSFEHTAVQLSLVVNLVVVDPVGGNWSSNEMVWNAKAFAQSLCRWRQLFAEIPVTH